MRVQGPIEFVSGAGVRQFPSQRTGSLLLLGSETDKPRHRITTALCAFLYVFHVDDQSAVHITRCSRHLTQSTFHVSHSKPKLQVKETRKWQLEPLIQTTARVPLPKHPEALRTDTISVRVSGFAPPRTTRESGCQLRTVWQVHVLCRQSEISRSLPRKLGTSAEQTCRHCESAKRQNSTPSSGLSPSQHQHPSALVNASASRMSGVSTLCLFN